MEDIVAGFIGFGFIGGSIGKALRELHPNSRIIAWEHGRGEENLLLAQREHIVDEVCTGLSESLSYCDIIFLCAPVLANIDYLKTLKGIMKPSCILTDVGSVKGSIHKAVTLLELDGNFIGGHPMAGSEKGGYLNSNSKLLENAYYILTPTDKTPGKMVDFLYQLISDMGALPLILDAKEHDNIVAAISHLPHIIAAGLVNLVKDSDTKDGKMHVLAAGGFKDITRIASSSPVMWQNICLSNTQSIKYFLDRYIAYLEDISNALDCSDEDYLYEVFHTAREYRDSIPKKGIGLITRIYEIYVDIIDKAGAIATIATILAKNHISMKNIGIIHNREFEEGVLRIEFYNEESLNQTVDLLRKCSYAVYER